MGNEDVAPPMQFAGSEDVAPPMQFTGSEDATPPVVLRFTDSRDAEDFSEQERCQKCRREGIDNRFIGERQTVKPFRFVRNNPV